MRQNKTSRARFFVAGLIGNIIVCGTWFALSRQFAHTLISVINEDPVININVYPLWIPIGFLGVIITTLSAWVVVVVTARKADVVWGKRGKKLITYACAFFLILGGAFGVVSYQWMQGRMAGNGYSYCKQLSR
ncbi:MAG: hypothetical protein ACRC4H_02755, partial [Plesiomonas sp.]